MAHCTDCGGADPGASKYSTYKVDQGQKNNVQVKSSSFLLFCLLHHDELTDVGLHEEEQVQEYCWKDGDEHGPDCQGVVSGPCGGDQPTTVRNCCLKKYFRIIYGNI